MLKYSQSGKVGAARGFKWKVGSVTKEGWFVKAQATQLCFVQSSRVGLTGAYFSFCISKTLSRHLSIPKLEQVEGPTKSRRVLLCNNARTRLPCSKCTNREPLAPIAMDHCTVWVKLGARIDCGCLRSGYWNVMFCGRRSWRGFPTQGLPEVLYLEASVASYRRHAV